MGSGRQSRRLTMRMAAVVSVAAVGCCGAVVLLGVANRDLRDASASAGRSQQRIFDATELGALVVDAQTAIRGFALTRRENYLDPYRLAARNLPGRAEALVRDTANDPPRDRAAQRIAAAAVDFLDGYATPLVAAERREPGAGRAIGVVSEGKRRVDAIRADVTAFVGAERGSGAVQTRADAAAAHAARALNFGIGAVVLVLVILAGVVVFLARFVARPIRDAAHAAERVGRGDAHVRLDDRRSDELGQLAGAFNAMGASLERSSGALDEQQQELRQQNAELETQAAAYERQASELAASHEQLLEVNRSLEASSQSLRRAQDREAVLARLGEDLGLRPALRDRAATLLSAVAEQTDAAVGAVYGISVPDDDVRRVLALRGLDERQLPPAITPGVGPAGRALADRTTVRVSRPDGDLTVDSFGVQVAVRHELHVPLLHGARAFGVLSVGNTSEAGFSDDSVRLAERLAEQTAVSLENAIETLRSRRLADLNRAVLDAAVDAIHLVDPEGETVISNRAMSRFRADVLQLPSGADLANVHDPREQIAARTADPDVYLRRLEEIFGDPTFEGSDEFQLIDTQRWVFRYTAPVVADDGERIGRIFVLRETTQERQAERAKDELMATVSHELRTPLSAVLGFTDLLLSREFGPDERAEHLKVIKEQGGRLSNLISDFLDLQRLDSGAPGRPAESVDLQQLLTEQVTLFASQSARHRLELRADTGLIVSADPERMGRVVGNLLSNAIKYSPEGGRVIVEGRRENGSVVVNVIDQGLGISETEQEKVFDRFYRVDNSDTRRIRGTGLGLALVRDLVRDAGGEVGVESVSGRGSRFWVRLPAQ